MTEHNVQRVAIAGFGAIGKVVAEHLDRGIDGLSLAAVSARDTKRAEAAMAGFAHAAPVLPLARLGEFADIVVECAPAALLRDIAEPALALGRTSISPGGMAAAFSCRPGRCWRSTRCRRPRSATSPGFT